MFVSMPLCEEPQSSILNTTYRHSRVYGRYHGLYILHLSSVHIAGSLPCARSGLSLDEAYLGTGSDMLKSLPCLHAKIKSLWSYLTTALPNRLLYRQRTMLVEDGGVPWFPPSVMAASVDWTLE